MVCFCHYIQDYTGIFLGVQLGKVGFAAHHGPSRINSGGCNTPDASPVRHRQSVAAGDVLKISIENEQIVLSLPIQNGGFPIAMFGYQRVVDKSNTTHLKKY